MNLVDLLSQRTIGHPTRLESITFEDGVLKLAVEGRIWWQTDSKQTEGRIELAFSGIASGALDMSIHPDPDDDEFLEDLDVRRVADVEWASPSAGSIYGHAPIPRPLDLYDRLEGYLQSRDATRLPADFLNGAHRLSVFLGFVSSNFYLLGSGPPAILDLLADELKKQGVPHQVASHSGRSTGAIMVRLGSHSFICDHATASFRGS